MQLKRFINFFFTSILVFLMLNVCFADDGPVIDKNQAQAIAQDYLNTHSYSSYKAVATDTLLAKVKDKSTGNTYWMDAGQAKSDVREENPKIDLVLNFVRVVDIVNNGKIVGKIYVDSYDNVGEIVYKELPENSATSSDGGSNGESSDGGDLTYNGSGDQNSGGIIGTIQSFFNGISSFFQQIWTSIFGGNTS
ncbi:hypothetical protein A994_09578 [Methanobacterium formicicum DSM 3637]|uniref:Uncharacterized protein n=2 Tax=Methanobacterium formicicum TaxID=2162 RepID=K2QAX4_METFP|nr:hypothetical protein A994_09578 [Methanobacterium formicicum DSM 3637]